MLRKRLHTRLLGALLAAAALATFASPASAGSYNVASCGKSPTGSMSGWSGETTAGSSWNSYFFTAQDCSSYGIARSFVNTTIPAGATFSWVFTAPADTYIEQASLYQNISDRAPGAFDNVVAERADGSRSLVASLVGTGNVNEGHYDASYSVPTGGSLPVKLRTEFGCQ